jgi:hypothetical protein
MCRQRLEGQIGQYVTSDRGLGAEESISLHHGAAVCFGKGMNAQIRHTAKAKLQLPFEIRPDRSKLQRNVYWAFLILFGRRRILILERKRWSRNQAAILKYFTTIRRAALFRGRIYGQP